MSMPSFQDTCPRRADDAAGRRSRKRGPSIAGGGADRGFVDCVRSRRAAVELGGRSGRRVMGGGDRALASGRVVETGRIAKDRERRNGESSPPLAKSGSSPTAKATACPPPCTSRPTKPACRSSTPTPTARRSSRRSSQSSAPIPRLLQRSSRNPPRSCKIFTPWAWPPGFCGI